MIESPLEDEQSEPIYRTVKIILSGTGIPFVSELFSAVIASPTEKRRDAFILALANDVKELQQKENISMSALSQNQEFVTTVIQAAHMWLRTHHETKQRALRAAMLNCARTPIDDSLRHMFLNMIDVLSPWHLDLLNFFSKGICWMRDDEVDRERRIPLDLSESLCTRHHPNPKEPICRNTRTMSKSLTSNPNYSMNC